VETQGRTRRAHQKAWPENCRPTQSRDGFDSLKEKNMTEKEQAKQILDRTREGWNIPPQQVTWALEKTGDIVAENSMMMQNQPGAIPHDTRGDDHGIWQRQRQEASEALSSSSTA
jgi:hypothetical protein